MNAQTTFLPDDALPLLALGTVAVVCGAIAVLGRRNAPDRSHPAIRQWYRRLEKPGLTPPDAGLGAVRPVLESGLAAGAYRLLRKPAARCWCRGIGAMVATSHAYFAASLRVGRPAAAAGVPFAVWLGFATLLAERAWERNLPDDETR